METFTLFPNNVCHSHEPTALYVVRIVFTKRVDCISQHLHLKRLSSTLNASLLCSRRPCFIPPPDTGALYTGTSQVLDQSFDVKFYSNPGPNQASVRYIQTVATSDGSELPDEMGGLLPPSTDYPFAQTFYQHEHALIEVDDDCKLLKWDQYGDNKEQTDVADLLAALVCAIGALPCPPS